MKCNLSILGAACTLALVASMPASAAGNSANLTEYERNQNAQVRREGTHATRKAERKVKRQELTSLNKAGELPQSGDDWGTNMNQPAPVAGTHESRAAERKVKRAELKEVVKSGNLPVTNEAVVSEPRK